MLLVRLAETSQALAATRSRNAKRDLLGGVLAEGGPDDVEIVVSYLGGSLRQRRTGVGWRSLRDMPTPAAEATLDVVEVDQAFERIAALSGAGSAGARTTAVTDLFGRATEVEQGFLVRLLSGELRQGALDARCCGGRREQHRRPADSGGRDVVRLRQSLLHQGVQRALP